MPDWTQSMGKEKDRSEKKRQELKECIMPKIIASIYEILDELGSGGGGTVYLANHLRLGKKVVLKADKRSITARPELLRREVDVLKHLSHAHIPQVYDFFTENETV